MRGRHATGATLLAATLAACAGAPPSFPPGADTGGGSGGTAVGATAGDPVPATSSGSSEGTSGSDTTTVGDDPGMPALSIDEGTVDFGDVTLGERAGLLLVVRNTGSSEAINLGASLRAGAFSFAGPAGFPGTGGDCLPILGAGEECRLELEFTPQVLGPDSGSVQLTADDAVAVSLPLIGRGVGTTANLLVNGDAEDLGAPPPGWVVVAGAWRAGAPSVVFPAHDGVGVLLAEAEGPNERIRVLEQAIDVSDIGELIDAGEVQVSLGGWLRMVNNGEVTMSLRADDAMGLPATLWSAPSVSGTFWTEASIGEALPAGAATLTVVLACDSGQLTCGGHFDDLELSLAYSPSAR